MNKAGMAVALMLIAVSSAPFLYTAAGNGLFHQPPKPDLVLPTNEKKCIEPAEFMRANHMKLLVHARDAIVRDHAIKPQHHLENCKTCHTKRAEFCDRCHDYAGVKPECWDCHYLP